MVGGSWVSEKSVDASKQSHFHPVPKAAFGGGEPRRQQTGLLKKATQEESLGLELIIVWVVVGGL